MGPISPDPVSWHSSAAKTSFRPVSTGLNPTTRVRVAGGRHSNPIRYYRGALRRGIGAGLAPNLGARLMSSAPYSCEFGLWSPLGFQERPGGFSSCNVYILKGASGQAHSLPWWSLPVPVDRCVGPATRSALVCTAPKLLAALATSAADNQGRDHQRMKDSIKEEPDWAAPSGPGSKPVKDNVKWTEKRLAMALLNASPAIAGRVLVVPNCSWAGWEADLLVIDQGLRIIDVEIKISRADLKVDIKKDKWWHYRPWSQRALPRANIGGGRRMRSWPNKVWKHYYVMPASIWSDALYEAIPKCSGVILVKADDRCSWGHRATVIRRAVPNRDAGPITAASAIDIARLASLRMWSVIRKDLK